MKSQSSKLSWIIVTLGYFHWLLLPAAYCQSPSLPAASGISIASGAALARPLKKYVTNQAEYAGELLKQSVTLEQLPEYAGRSQFIGGFTFPHLKGGLGAQLHFNCRESNSIVSTWYKQALNQAGWTLDQSSNDSLIGAYKQGGYYCQIMLQRSYTPQFRTDVRIFYRHNPLPQ